MKKPKPNKSAASFVALSNHAEFSATGKPLRKVTREQLREQKLLPGGIPRWVRCYDSDAPPCRHASGGDRYTIVFTGRWRRNHDASSRCQYVSMSASPLHPQGVCQHGEHDRMIDVNKWGFAPAMGRRNHLGRRIPFLKLPDDCKKIILREYREIWGLK